MLSDINILFLCWLYVCSINFYVYYPFFKFWHYIVSLNRDFENTSEINYLKIVILHGKIYMLFSQFIFSISTCFQRAHNINKVFLNYCRLRFKKAKSFLFSGISSDILLIFFYVSFFYIWRNFLLNSMSNFQMNFSFVFILLEFPQN